MSEHLTKMISLALVLFVFVAGAVYSFNPHGEYNMTASWCVFSALIVCMLFHKEL